MEWTSGDAIDFARLFAASPDAYAVVRPHAPFTILTLTDAYARAAGEPREALVGRGLFDLFQADEGDPMSGATGLRASLARVLRDGTADALPIHPYEVRRPDGGFDERWWSTVNAPVRTADGEIACVIHRIAEAPSEAWASTIVHDLRQPLNAIAISAQILGRAAAGASPEQAKAITRLRWATKALDGMLADLLDASRLEAGRVLLDRAEIDIGRLARGVVDALDLTSRCEVRIEPAASGVRVLLDEAQIERVLVTLLTYAARDGAGSFELMVGCRGGAELLVAVTSRGPGVPPEELPHLFDRFRRRGLGLYVAKGLVEAHGGRLAAESAPGRTRFEATLPRRST